MEALRAKKKQLEVGEMHTEMVPKLIGHIEKIEEEEMEEDTEEANMVPTEGASDEGVAKKGHGSISKRHW